MKTGGNLLNFKRDPSDVSRKPAGNYLMCLEKSSTAFVLFCPRRLLCFSVLRLQMSPTELERLAGGKPCKNFGGWRQKGSLLKTNKQTIKTLKTRGKIWVHTRHAKKLPGSPPPQPFSGGAAGSGWQRAPGSRSRDCSFGVSCSPLK